MSGNITKNDLREMMNFFDSRIAQIEKRLDQLESYSKYTYINSLAIRNRVGSHLSREEEKIAFTDR